MSRTSVNRRRSRRGRERERVSDRYYKVETDYDTDVSRGPRRVPDRDSRRHDRDLYDYSTYDVRYSPWRDLYRDDYYRGYDYGYYDDYYDYPYDDYDYYPEETCRACSRGRRMRPDPYIYRYEEDRSPRRRRHESRRHSRRVTREEPARAKAGPGKNVSVYAMQEVAGNDGFKDQKEKKVSDPRTKQEDGKQLKPVVSSDSSERESRGNERRARRTGRKRSVNEYDDWD